MRDGPLRRAVKAVALVGFRANLAAWRGWRHLRGDRPYLLGGSCNLCAQCCDAPAISVLPAVWYLPLLRRAFLRWQRVVNGFDLVRTDVAQRAFIFRCSHFDAATRRCDSYDSRPGMCRDYPRVLLDQTLPDMLPGCGYTPIAPGAEGLIRALQRLALTPDQDAKLRKGLFLRPR